MKKQLKSSIIQIFLVIIACIIWFITGWRAGYDAASDYWRKPLQNNLVFNYISDYDGTEHEILFTEVPKILDKYYRNKLPHNKLMR